MRRVIGIHPWVDFAFKKIFGKPGNEICLISFLNSVLDLPAPIVEVQYLNPFSFKEFKENKLICVDVKATDTQGQIFVIETQVNVNASFSKRALYYAAKNYSDQLKEGQGYHKLKATYAVCLLVNPVWKDDRFHHHFRMTEKESGEVLQDGIEIHSVELSKYNGTLSSLVIATPLEQWCYWFKHSHEHTVEELRELLPGLAFLQATRELYEIQEVKEEKQMYDSREKGQLDWQASILDAEAEGLEKGLKMGLEKGREEGREEGLERGQEKGEIKLIRTLQDILSIPISEDSEFDGKTLVELQMITASLRDQIHKRP